MWVCNRGTYGQQFLLDLHIKGSTLHSDDLRGSIRIMSDWGTAFRAEDAVDVLAGASLTGPALGWAIDLNFIFRHYNNESYAAVSLKSC